MLQTMLTLYKSKVPFDYQLPVLKYAVPAELANQTDGSILRLKNLFLNF
jgi:hypothetical protein